jgi:hypothetical protein
MSATALQPTAVTQAIRPAALVELQVALPVARQHAQPRGQVAGAVPAGPPGLVLAGLLVPVVLVAAALVVLRVQVLRAAFLQAVRLLRVLPAGQVVLLERVVPVGQAGLPVPALPLAQVHLEPLQAARRVVVERQALLPAVATTGH